MYDNDDFVDAYNADQVQHEREEILRNPSDRERECINSHILHLAMICLQDGEVEVSHYVTDTSVFVELHAVIAKYAGSIAEQCVNTPTNMPDISDHVIAEVRDAYTGGYGYSPI